MSHRSVTRPNYRHFRSVAPLTRPTISMDKRQAELGHPRSVNRTTFCSVIFAVLTPLTISRCGRCVRFRRLPYPLCRSSLVTPTAEDTAPDSTPPHTPPLPVCCISHTASHCIWGSERGPPAPYPSHCRNCTAAAAPAARLLHRPGPPRGAPRRLRAVREWQRFTHEESEWAAWDLADSA